MRERFWERFPLEELDEAEWEALCDGCGRCCLLKLEDEDSGELYYTSLSCRLLDTESCACTSYADRSRKVPDCMRITPEMARNYRGLPSSCAYVRLARDQGLPDWHPLRAGGTDGVHRAGVSVRGRVRTEEGVPEDDYEEYIIQWVEY